MAQRHHACLELPIRKCRTPPDAGRNSIRHDLVPGTYRSGIARNMTTHAMALDGFAGSADSAISGKPLDQRGDTGAATVYRPEYGSRWSVYTPTGCAFLLQLSPGLPSAGTAHVKRGSTRRQYRHRALRFERGGHLSLCGSFRKYAHAR